MTGASRVRVLLAIAVLSHSWQPSLSEGILTLEDYLAELEAISSTLEGGESTGLPPGGWVVAVEEERFEVSGAALRAGLSDLAAAGGEGEAVLIRVRETIDRMVVEAEAWSETYAASEPARDELAEILSRREFNHVSAPGPLDRIRDRIASWLEGILTGINRRVMNSPVLAEAIAWLVISVVVALALIGVMRAAGRRGMLLRFSPGPPVPSPPPRKDWMLQLAAAARSGRFRDAVRCAYWAGVHAIADEGIWPLDATRTPREYLRSLPEGHPSRPSMARATQHFESVWYGGAPATEEDLEVAVGQLRALGLDTSWHRQTAGS